MGNTLTLLKVYDKCHTIDIDTEGNCMISIRLNKDVEKQLKEVAKFEGVSVSDYVRNLINERMEDLYDYKVAEKSYKEFIKSGKKGYTLEEVFKEDV